MFPFPAIYSPSLFFIRLFITLIPRDCYTSKLCERIGKIISNVDYNIEEHRNIVFELAIVILKRVYRGCRQF